VLTAVTAWVLLGPRWAAVPAVVVGVVTERVLARLPDHGGQRWAAGAADDLPIAADLFAAALRCGAPPDRAAAAVGRAVDGPVGVRLQRVARALRLGAGPAEAWSHLSALPGTDRLVAIAVRRGDSGAGFAGALGRLADDLRADRRDRTAAAARRAGVLTVLPLGLCFLPAFLLAGLLPVVIAVVGSVGLPL
jgi:pilus assembly protein TadC